MRRLNFPHVLGVGVLIAAWATASAYAAAVPPAKTTPARSQTVAPEQTPQGMNASDWASVQRQIAAQRYRVSAPDQATSAYRADNPSLGLAAKFHADGSTRVQVSGAGPAKPDTQDSASLRLAGLGYVQLQSFGTTPERVAEPTGEGGKLTYRWSQQVSEWWVNAPGQLEQWFRIEQRPAGVQAGQPLRLTLKVDTALQPVMVGQQLQLKDKKGATRMHYDQLKVWDATGKQMPASMQLAGRTLTLAVQDQAAQYPLTIDPSWGQTAYLKASNIRARENFGYSVSLSGDTLAVGAENGSGAVYVFTRSAGNWSQQAHLNASNIGGVDRFGHSVSLSGDTLVVGADWEGSGSASDPADSSARDSGAVYVFTRSGTTWSEQAYLKASNIGADDQFGSSVSLSGDRLAVGAPGESSGSVASPADNSTFGSGAVYVFTRSGTSWSQEAYLKASHISKDDGFGTSVSLSGDTLAVGAKGESSGLAANPDDNSAASSGAVYVFTLSGSNWSQQAYLKASNIGAYDRFGTSVSLFGNTLVVGAPNEDSSSGANPANNSAVDSGAVYVFTRSGTSWSQQAYVKAANAKEDDQFGYSVSLSGDNLAVGAHYEQSGSIADPADSSATRSGAVYVFTRGGTDWSQQAYLKASNIGANDNFGASVSLFGDTLAAGAPYEDSGSATDPTDNSAVASGAAYTFKLAANPADGVCGSANGVPVSTAPSANLCSAGTESAVTGTGPWNWSCSAAAAGGASASCSAPLAGGGGAPVTTFNGPAGAGGGNVNVVLSGGGATCGFDGTPSMIAAAPGAVPPTPPGIVFPHGLFDFKTVNCTPGSSVTLTMTFPAALPAGTQYYKWGPEPANTTPHWYVMPAQINGSTVTFSVTDGGQGDDDLLANGAIVDQGGPGVPGDGGVTPVPTLGQWALALLGLLAASLGVNGLRRKTLSL